MTEKNSSEKSEERSKILKSFTLDWDSVVRVIGSIAGMAGIFTAILFYYGYAYYVGQLRAMSISDRVFASTPDQSYLLRQGMTSFSFLIIHIGIFILIYYILQAIVNLIGKRFTNHVISHNWKFSAIGFVLGVLVIISGSIYGFRRTPPEHIIAVALSILLGLQIFLYTFKSSQTSDDEYLKTDSFYNLVIRTISTTTIIGIIITSYLLFTFHLGNSTALGSYFVCNDIQFNSTSVILFSEKPIAIDGGVNSGNSFRYDGYFLLLVDNNNYYLYRELEPDTVKPKSVYIIKKDELIGIESIKSSNPIDWSSNNSCFNPYSNP